MITASNIADLANADEVEHYVDRYWPRWLRNSFAAALGAIMDAHSDGMSEPYRETTKTLIDRLVLPTRECRDLDVLEKHRVLLVYRAFRVGHVSLDCSSRHSWRDISGSVGEKPFDIAYAGDMFASQDCLTRSVSGAIEEVFREVGIALRISYACPSHLVMYAPDEQSLQMLKGRIPRRFHLFCEFAIDGVGPVCAERAK